MRVRISAYANNKEWTRHYYPINQETYGLFLILVKFTDLLRNNWRFGNCILFELLTQLFY